MIDGPPHNRKRSLILLCECHNMEFLVFDTENKEAVMGGLGTCLECGQTSGWPYSGARVIRKRAEEKCW
jgi:hypothetical protein